MAENGVELRPGIYLAEHARSENCPHFTPPTPAERVEGPFVLAMTAHYNKLLATATAAHWREGYRQGMRDNLLMTIAVAALCLWIGWAFA